jgi:hypothetical protein
MPGSPVTDNVTIAAISADCAHPVQDLEGMAYAKRRLGTFKNKVSSNNAMKLTSSNVFPWICDIIVLCLATKLGTKSCVEALVQKKRELYYSRFLTELYGDHGQMLLVTSNFKVYLDKTSKLCDNDNVMNKQVDIGDAYWLLTFPADIYNTFVQSTWTNQLASLKRELSFE